MPQMVLMLIPSDRNRAVVRRTHAPDCKWIAGTKGLDYRAVDVKDIPASQPRCSHCGGGR